MVKSVQVKIKVEDDVLPDEDEKGHANAQAQAEVAMSAMNNIIVIDDDESVNGNDCTRVNSIDESTLFKLEGAPANATAFPPGCPTRYGFNQSSSGEISFRTGYVKAAFMDYTGPTFTHVFKVIDRDSDNKRAPDGEAILVRQEQLAYGDGCPVKVKRAGGGQFDIDGEIRCIKPVFYDDGNLRSIKYSAVLFHPNKKRTDEDNIPPRKVEHRRLAGSAPDASKTNERAKSTADEGGGAASKVAEKSSSAVPSSQEEPARQKTAEYFNKQVAQPMTLSQQQTLIPSNESTDTAVQSSPGAAAKAKASLKGDNNLGKRQADLEKAATKFSTCGAEGRAKTSSLPDNQSKLHVSVAGAKSCADTYETMKPKKKRQKMEAMHQGKSRAGLEEAAAESATFGTACGSEKGIADNNKNEPSLSSASASPYNTETPRVSEPNKKRQKKELEVDSLLAAPAPAQVAKDKHHLSLGGEQVGDLSKAIPSPENQETVYKASSSAMTPQASGIGKPPTKVAAKDIVKSNKCNASGAKITTTSTVVVQGATGVNLTDAEKKEKERFVMFTRALIKYLELRDNTMHAKAKAQIKECYEKNKRGDPAFKSLTVSMKARLRATVGEVYWKKANDYLEHFLKQKQKPKKKKKKKKGSEYDREDSRKAKKTKNDSGETKPSMKLDSDKAETNKEDGGEGDKAKTNSNGGANNNKTSSSKDTTKKDGEAKKNEEDEKKPPDENANLPLLVGTLAYSYSNGNNLRRHIIRGKWKYEHNHAIPPQRFELIRAIPREEELKELPKDGVFQGYFNVKHQVKTSKGKVHMKNRAVPESGVNLKFKAMGGSEEEDEVEGKFSVNGTGFNEYGMFELFGTATKNTEVKGDTTYSVSLHKRYLLVPSPPPPTELPKKGLFMRGKLVPNEFSLDNTAVHRFTGLWTLGTMSKILDEPDTCEKFEFEHKCSRDSVTALSGRYTGFICVSEAAGQRTKVVQERDVTLKFRLNNEGYHNVEGRGSNPYGKYTLTGTLDKDGTMALVRVYGAIKLKANNKAHVKISPAPASSLLTCDDVNLPAESDGPPSPLDPPDQFTAMSRGILKMEDDGTHVCSGSWAMTNGHLQSGLISKYHFGIPAHHAGDDAKLMLDRMKASGQDEDDDRRVHKTSDGESPVTLANSTFPIDSTQYKGSFKLRKGSTGTQTVVDSQIVLMFVKNSGGSFNVYGKGSNEMGTFDLVGTLILQGKTNGLMELYRMYPQVEAATVAQV